jgi:hypothetical protein
LVRFFPVRALLSAQLNLGRVSSPELVQLLVKAGSREQHPDGKDAKRGNPYGLSVGDNELKEQVHSTSRREQSDLSVDLSQLLAVIS